MRMPLNGVDTPTLFATLDAVKATPALAKFQFRARNTWLAGTHSRTTIDAFSGAGGEQRHAVTFEYDADHPAVLVGADQGPTPVEFLLHALSACITSGIGNIAAARGIRLSELSSTIEGDIDLRGIFGHSPEARNGYEQLRVSFTIKGDAPEDQLRALVEQGRKRSAVYDVLTNGVPIDITVQAG